MDDNCIFCKIIDKKIPSEIIFEDDFVIAFKDINPKSDLHVLVVPKKHISSIDDLGLEESGLLCKIVFAAKDIAKNFEISRSGYKLIFNVKEAGGQIIPHIHLHLLAGKKFLLP